MPTKKQGRRSAEDAEQTQWQILQATHELFCEFGYSNVSLRNISDKAGISHSLIRHHFGSKEQIWHCICDINDEFIGEYSLKIVENLDSNLNIIERVYQFIVRMLAFHLVHPDSIKFMSDVARAEGSRFDHLMKKMGERQSKILSVVDESNELCLSDAEIAEITWQILMHAQSAASLRPLMTRIWADQTKDYDQCLLLHWSIFNDSICRKLDIPVNRKLAPESINDLVYDVASCCRIAINQTTTKQ